jgi:hypothetical protein
VSSVLALTATLCWAWAPGRMTGGGSVFTDTGIRVTRFRIAPGVNDTAMYRIEAPDGMFALVVSERQLTFGNHQAHAN